MDIQGSRALGGLECLVVSIGVPGFGPAGSASHDDLRTLFEVNALGRWS